MHECTWAGLLVASETYVTREKLFVSRPTRLMAGSEAEDIPSSPRNFLTQCCLCRRCRVSAKADAAPNALE